MAEHTFNPANATLAPTCTGVNMYRGLKPSAFVTNEGEIRILRYLLDDDWTWYRSQEFSVHLFVNDVTIDKYVEYDDFTECTASGYSYKDLDGTWWVTEEGTSAVVTHEDVVFTLTSGATIYGAVVCIGEWLQYVVWVQKFDAPVVIGAGGGEIAVCPELKCGA